MLCFVSTVYMAHKCVYVYVVHVKYCRYHYM